MARFNIIIGVEADLKGLPRISLGLKKLGRDGDKASRGIDRTRRSLSRLRGVIATVVFGAIAREVLDATLALERIEGALAQATGGAEAASEEWRFLQQETNRLGTNLRQSAKEYSSLTAAAKGTNLEGEATREIFLAISEAGTVMNLTSEQMGGALQALQQIISKGKVSAEELRGQLGERLPGAMQIAARAIQEPNESLQEANARLNKMLETGKLYSEDFLPAFAAEMRRTFADQVPTATANAQSALNRFDNAMFLLQTQIGDGAVPALAELAEQIGSLASSGDMQAFAQDLGTGVGAIISWIGDMISWLGKLGFRWRILRSAVAEVQADVVELVGGMVDKVLRFFAWMIEGVADLGEAVGIDTSGLQEFAKGVRETSAGLVSDAQLLAEGFREVSEEQIDLQVAADRAAEAIQAQAGQMGKLGSATLKTKREIVDLKAKAKEAFEEMERRLERLADLMEDEVSRGFRELDIGETAVDSINSDLERWGDLLIIVQDLQLLTMTTQERILALRDQEKQAVSDVFEAFDAGLISQEEMVTLLERLPELFKQLRGEAGEVQDIWKTAAKNIFSDLSVAAANAFSDLITGAKSAAEVVQDLLVSAFSAIGAALGTALGGPVGGQIGASLGAAFGTLLGGLIGGGPSFDAPTFVGVSNGQTILGNATGERRRVAEQVSGLLDDLLGIISGFATLIPSAGVQIREDGEQFRAIFQGQVLGVFETLDEAMEAGIIAMLKNAELLAAPPEVQQVLEASHARTLDAMEDQLRVAQAIADLRTGIGPVGQQIRELRRGLTEDLAIAREVGLDAGLLLVNFGKNLDSLRDSITGTTDALAEEERQRRDYNAGLAETRRELEARLQALLGEQSLAERRGSAPGLPEGLDGLDLLGRNVSNLGEVAGRTAEEIQREIDEVLALLAELPDPIRQDELPGRREERRRRAEGRRQVREDVRRGGLTQLDRQLEDIVAGGEAFEESLQGLGFSLEETASLIAANDDLLNQDLRELGQNVLVSLGVSSAQARAEIGQTDQAIQFLRTNFEALGLTMDEVEDAVREVGDQLFVSLGDQLSEYIDNEEDRRALEQIRHQLFVAQMRLQLELVRDMGLLTEAQIAILDRAIARAEQGPASDPETGDVDDTSPIGGTSLGFRRIVESNTRLSDSLNALQRAVTRLREFRESLTVGPLSPLPVREQLAEQQSRLDELLAAANTGDAEAIEELPEASRTFLELLRQVTPSGSQAFRNEAGDLTRQVDAILDRFDRGDETRRTNELLDRTWRAIEAGNRDRDRLMSRQTEATEGTNLEVRRLRTDLQPSRLVA